MNENLKKSLYDAYQVAANREELMGEYKQECLALRSKQANIDHISIFKRLKYAIIPLCCFYIGGLLLDTTEYTMDMTFSDFNMFQKGCVILAYGGLGLGILLLITAKFIYYNTKKYKEKCADIKDEEVELERVFNEEMQKINRMPGAFVPGLPQKYHTTHALEYMLEYVDCGVNNIRELIQMYEEQCHRERMENMQDRLLQEAMEQNDRLDQLETQINYIKYYS